ncbi:hypothetical protein TRAPUB_8454 [Trametes pubescens]|uniref:F-box domain-containing protein n=1 Tax=Trametes pubescens TaxID=154538 RepID=A0A1M2W578_TRAPU|nr:hypothetical protein TRAPUB_8454 [Trametes pubescens]
MTDLATSKGLNSFPPELLIIVFEHNIGAVAALNCVLIRATHVCRYWRDVALHSPTLWSHIALMHPDAVEHFLARSQALHLRISVDMNANGGSETSKKMRLQALHVLLGHAACSRILSLKISHLPKSRNFNWVIQHIAHAAPQLETLLIERCVPRVLIPRPSTHPADFEGVPKLRSLTLIGEIPPLFSKAPNSLTSLDLDRPVCDVSSLLHLLERSPSLEHLIIRNIIVAGVERPTGAVILPRLKTLRLQCISNLAVGKLRPKIVLPSKHTNITLCDSKSYGQMFQDLVPAHGAPDALSFPALHGLKHVQLLWEHNLWTLRAYRSSDLAHSAAPALQVHSSRPTLDGERFLINWPIDASHVETIDLYGNSTKFYAERRLDWQWATMLFGVPALKTLRVRAVPKGILQAILSALGPGADTVACPQLETLILGRIPLPEESRDTLVGVAKLRGPLMAAGGYLGKIMVELPVFGPDTVRDEPAWSLIEGTGVQVMFIEPQ